MLKTLGDKLPDGRWFSPAAERNKEPIAEALRGVLPARGTVLEIASGTGQHVVHFAHVFPALEWQPSDPDAELRQAIALRVSQEALDNVLPALELDVRAASWPLARADALVCLNMLHVAPWAACDALMRGAARLLPPGGVLFLYGPYRRRGRPTAPSNEAFDRALRAQDPQWGLRELDAVIATAASHGIGDPEVIEMPANNLSVVLRRPGTA